jgi:hypothetical protein
MLLTEWIDGVLRRSESARSSVATPWQPAVPENCASLALEIYVVAAAVEFNGVDLQAFTRTCFEVGLIFHCVSGQRTADVYAHATAIAYAPDEGSYLQLIACRRQPVEL